MQSINFTFPAWLVRLPYKEHGRARARFILKFAAIMATPEGSITALSIRIGFNKNSLNAMLSQGALDDGLSPSLIKAIEQVIGVGVIPREAMNPEVYGQL